MRELEAGVVWTRCAPQTGHAHNQSETYNRNGRGIGRMKSNIIIMNPFQCFDKERKPKVCHLGVVGGSAASRGVVLSAQWRRLYMKMCLYICK